MQKCNEPWRDNWSDWLWSKKPFYKANNPNQFCLQSRFGGKSELATEDEPSVKDLCKAFQDILQHGITVKGKATNNNTGGKPGKLIS